jgi:hypothetical protein
MSLGEQFRSDRSVVALLLSNLLTMIWALVEGWEIADVMLVYWVQSVVIGYFNYYRIMDLKEFSTKNLRMNNKRPDATPETKRSVARFFVLHYGIFHAAYLAFILGKDSGEVSLSSIGIVVCIVAFYFNHRYSYRHNRERDSRRVPNIGTMMLFPYARIVPMHLTIGMAASRTGGSTKALFIFLILKTLADIVMHMIEHADARQIRRGLS